MSLLRQTFLMSKILLKKNIEQNSLGKCCFYFNIRMLFDRNQTHSYLILNTRSLRISKIGFYEEATFTMTRMGNLKLIDKNGFGYTKVDTYKDVTYWRCSKGKTGKCRCRAHTRDFGEQQMVRFSGQHNHYPKRS